MDVNEFAQVVLAQTKAYLKAQYPNSPQHEWEQVEVVPGPKYAKVNIGPGEMQMAGKYMVENETGVIYGIKGYGRVHRGHTYGTLDTVNDWYWGGYTGELVKGVALGRLSPAAKRFVTDRAVRQFQAELTASAPAIAKVLDEFEQEEATVDEDEYTPRCGRVCPCEPPPGVMYAGECTEDAGHYPGTLHSASGHCHYTDEEADMADRAFAARVHARRNTRD